MAIDIRFMGRWAALAWALGLVGAVSCSDSADNDGDHSSAGTRSGAGGSGGSGGTPSDAGGGGGERHCQDYATEAACEAAGCVPTTGTLSRLLPTDAGGAGGQGGVTSAGGAGGAGIIGAACERVEDVFISCEEGFGGAVFETACNVSCTACLGGPWTVGRFEPYTSRACEEWSCVDGTARAGIP